MLELFDRLTLARQDTLGTIARFKMRESAFITHARICTRPSLRSKPRHSLRILNVLTPMLAHVNRRVQIRGLQKTFFATSRAPHL